MASISPTNPPCVFKIYVNFQASGILTLERTVSSTTVSEKLHGNTALLANVPYVFYTHVDSTESINLQYSVTTTANKISVVEIDLATPHETDSHSTEFTADNVGLTKSTQLPANLDGSGYMKTHEQGTANTDIGQSSSYAKDATLTGGAIKTKVWDGTNQVVVSSSGYLHHILETDNVGLAKTGQLPTALDGSGNFKIRTLASTDNPDISVNQTNNLKSDIGQAGTYSKDATLKHLSQGTKFNSSVTANTNIF
jgi:hypothetical protein